MASEDRTEAYALINRLFASPYSFDFFQAVRRLENAHPDLPRTGHSRHPRQDPVRFGQEPSLAFAPSTLKGLKYGRSGRAPRLFVNFMGLLGPNGPMPLRFTEHAIERRRERDHTIARFLDVFHHRMIALFYRAWATCNQAVNFERGDDDRYAMAIGSLFGIGMPSLRGRDAVPDVAKIYFAGRLACPSRHAEGLQAILSGYFKLDTEIEEFVGHWMPVPEDCRCRLGESPRTGSLGLNAICGSRIWDCQQKFRTRFGPMSLDDYRRMLPDGDSFVRLVTWMRNYIGEELSWDVQLVLHADEVPQTQLGSLGQLGWTTWLRSKPFPRDADDLVLRPFAS